MGKKEKKVDVRFGKLLDVLKQKTSREQYEARLALVRGALQSIQAGQMPVEFPEEVDDENLEDSYDNFCEALEGKVLDESLKQELHAVLVGKQGFLQEDKQTLLDALGVQQAKQEVLDNSAMAQRPENQAVKTALSKVLQECSGEASITAADDESITLKISGSLEAQYSVFSSFRHCQVATEAVQMTDKTQQELVMKLDRKKVNKLLSQLQALEKVQKWLASQGYNVRVGNKACEELFRTNPHYNNSDKEKLLSKSGVSLAVADALMEKGDSQHVVLPLCLHVDTTDEQLMQQLETYYREAGLKDSNGNNKEFMQSTKDNNVKESNIDAYDCQKLMAVIGRLAMHSKMLGKPCSELSDEKELEKADKQLRGHELDGLRKVVAEANEVKSLEGYEQRRIGAQPFYLQTQPEQKKSSMALFSYGPTKQSHNPLTELQYEQQFEQLLNENYVLSPEAFQLFDNGEQHSQHSPQIEMLSEIVDSLSLEDEMKTCGPLVALENNYVQKHCPAQSYLSGGQSPNRQLWRVFADMGSGRADACPINPNNRLGALRAFLNYHTPYYLVQSLASSIANKLDANENGLTEKEIEKLLLSLSVPEEALSLFKFPGDSDAYNRQHIKHQLLSLVAYHFAKTGLLLNYKQACHSNHPQNDWVTHPTVGYRATQTYEQGMSSGDNWPETLLWRVNKTYKTGWGSTAEKKQSTYTSHVDTSYQSSRTSFSYQKKDVQSSTAAKSGSGNSDSGGGGKPCSDVPGAEENRKGWVSPKLSRI